MWWFSKTKTNKDFEIFQSEFPIWVAIQSTKLVDKLHLDKTTGWAKILKNREAKERLINCLIGAHVFYLRFGSEGEFMTLLFGKDFFKKTLSILPDKSKVFFFLAYSLYEKDNKNRKDNLTSLLENFHKIKIDPLDACVAFITDQEVNGSEEFSMLPRELLHTLNCLRIQQLEWLKGIVNKWSQIK